MKNGLQLARPAGSRIATTEDKRNPAALMRRGGGAAASWRVDDRSARTLGSDGKLSARGTRYYLRVLGSPRTLRRPLLPSEAAMVLRVAHASTWRGRRRPVRRVNGRPGPARRCLVAPVLPAQTT
jgi:hypothetical protein